MINFKKIAIVGKPEGELPTEPRPGAAYIRVVPVNYLSWDYARG